MSYSFIARMKIKPEKEAEFVALCQEMEEVVRRHEPHILGYKFYRLAEPGGFAVYESFAEEKDSLAHQTHPQVAPIIEKMIPCMEDGYAREYLLPLS